MALRESLIVGPRGSTGLLARLPCLIVYVALGMMSVSCGTGLAQKPIPGRGHSSLVTGKAFLVAGQSEGEGFGLYSYLLFEKPPAPQDRAKYLAAVEAWLREFPDLNRLETSYSRARLNAALIPVREPLEVQGPKTSGLSEGQWIRSNAERVLDGYDYERSRAILTRLRSGGVPLQGGPYLLSSLGPFLLEKRQKPALFQDLSAISLIPGHDKSTRVVFEWVLDFVDRASNPRAGEWDQASLEEFRRQQFNSQRTAFFHAGVPSERLAQLAPYIAIVFPLEDERANQTFDIPRPRFQGKHIGRSIWLVRQL